MQGKILPFPCSDLNTCLSPSTLFIARYFACVSNQAVPWALGTLCYCLGVFWTCRKWVASPQRHSSASFTPVAYELGQRVPNTRCVCGRESNTLEQTVLLIRMMTRGQRGTMQQTKGMSASLAPLFVCPACAMTRTYSSSLQSTLSYGSANCILVKSQVETSLLMCCFRYYSEKPTNTALRSPGSQYHQREDPAVSLLLLHCHSMEMLDGRALSVFTNDCINVSPNMFINVVFSSFSCCYVVISKYLYVT